MALFCAIFELTTSERIDGSETSAIQPVAIAGATLLFWMLASQQIADISHDFTAGFEVASHYVDAKTNWETEPFDIAFVMIVAPLIPLHPWFLGCKTAGQGLIHAGMFPGIFCVLLWLVFKFTFVGVHGHRFPVYWGSTCLIAMFCPRQEEKMRCCPNDLWSE
jgi:hypothetical protein